MNGKRDKILEPIIHEPMTGKGAQAVELRTADNDAEMTGSGFGAGMACVKVRLIDDFELGRRKRL